ncbi:MAG: OmpP1/FadL family transporter [Desulfopila sp.]
MNERPGTRSIRCGNKKLFIFAICTFGFLSQHLAHGAGFQIPNQSLKAIGSAGANIAYTPGPDAAYYNPANLSLLDDRWALETSLTTLWLPKIDYRDNRSSALDGSSDLELFFLPQIHLASRDYHNFRFGFSLTSPYGLAKNWDQPFPRAFAGKFSLFVTEANPSVSYKVSDHFSVAAGVRGVYAKGKVKNFVDNPPIAEISPLTDVDRDLEANDVAYGYNLAATYRPTADWRIATTYRSKIDLHLKGSGDLAAMFGPFPYDSYSGSANLDITLPAVFAIAVARTFGPLTLEAAWNRTFWSDLNRLDFDYGRPVGPALATFDQPVEKDWKDSNSYRFGLTYQWSPQLTSTLGFAIEKTPVPERTLNFEMPDSDAYMYGLGLQYAVQESLKLGVSYMYYYTTSRDVSSDSTGIDGTFDKGDAHAITVGAIASF